jgi:cytochrome c-type protein NapB
MSAGRIPTVLALAAVAAASLVAGLAGAADPPAGPARSSAQARAERRAYDGAPPVIPHDDFRSTCGECHNERGVAVAGVGFAPPSPHAATGGMSDRSRCRQCHVFRLTAELWRGNDFAGLEQDLRPGRRQHPLAPPRLPHPVLMRENCQACHAGAATRDEIRTSHPERARCRQCHVPVTTLTEFER